MNWVFSLITVFTVIGISYTVYVLQVLIMIWEDKIEIRQYTSKNTVVFLSYWVVKGLWYVIMAPVWISWGMIMGLEAFLISKTMQIEERKERERQEHLKEIGYYD